MAFLSERKLVVAVSSSAVFDMAEADAVFRDKGPAAYREYQKDLKSTPFEKGVAFPFIKRLLHLNTKFRDQQPIEVVVLSRNDPDSGQRFFESCRFFQLDITRGAFLCGSDPYHYISAFNASLFLSANETDVRGALAVGMPAGLVLPSKVTDEQDENELRIAFDFDGVLANDESETVFRSGDLPLFQQHEQEHAERPLNPGPLKGLAQKLSYWQKYEAKLQRDDPSYTPLLRIAIVTARNAPAHARFVRTLEEWGLTATETFLMGGIEKSRVLRVFKPHLFLDDQIVHLQDIANEIPCVHIPFGIANDQKR